MSPECLYWVALSALVLPSVPFNRLALIVLTVWAFGHFVHMSSQYESAAYMFARIVAIGAALAVSHPWDGSRRALAHATVTALFAPTAILAAIAAIYFDHPPETDAEYQWQLSVYWLSYNLMMLQALAIPIGNDWDKVKRAVMRLDDALLRRIEKHFNGAL